GLEGARGRPVHVLRRDQSGEGRTLVDDGGARGPCRPFGVRRDRGIRAGCRRAGVGGGLLVEGTVAAAEAVEGFGRGHVRGQVLGGAGQGRDVDAGWIELAFGQRARGRVHRQVLAGAGRQHVL